MAIKGKTKSGPVYQFESRLHDTEASDHVSNILGPTRIQKEKHVSLRQSPDAKNEK